MWGGNTACLLAGGGGGGGLCLTRLCSTSPPQGEIGGKLGPSEIDVSSIAPCPKRDARNVCNFMWFETQKHVLEMM